MIIPTSHDMYPVLVVGCVIMVLMVVVLITLFDIQKKLARPEREETMKILRDQHEGLQNRYVPTPPPPPPPPKKAVAFKVGDRVFVKSAGADGEICARTDGHLKVREIGGTSASCWYEIADCQLISKESGFKVGDRVRIRSELGVETVGEIISITDHGTATVDFGPTPPTLLWISSIEFPLDSLELICEKQS